MLEVWELCSQLLPQTPDSVNMLYIDSLIALGNINSAQTLLTECKYTDSMHHRLELLKAKVYIHSNKVYCFIIVTSL